VVSGAEVTGSGDYIRRSWWHRREKDLLASMIFSKHHEALMSCPNGTLLVDDLPLLVGSTVVTVGIEGKNTGVA
jgi:hypothetical protein